MKHPICRRVGESMEQGGGIVGGRVGGWEKEEAEYVLRREKVESVHRIYVFNFRFHGHSIYTYVCIICIR